MDKKKNDKKLSRDENFIFMSEQINDVIAASGSLSPSLSRTSTDISSLDTAACEISSSALSLSSKPQTTPKVRNRLTNALKSIRPRALVPKRFKSDLSAAKPLSPAIQKTPEVNRKSNKPDDNSDGKSKKKSRASNFVKRFSIGKKTKVTGEPDSLSSKSVTPTSAKKLTPDVLNKSVSEVSLLDIVENVNPPQLPPPPSVHEVETKQFFTRGEHLRIKISGHKSTIKKPNEKEILKKQHLELHKEGLAVVIDSGIDAITITTASQQTKDIQLPVETNNNSGDNITSTKKSLIPRSLDVKSGHLQSECKPINTVEVRTSSSLHQTISNNFDNQATGDKLEKSESVTVYKETRRDSITKKLLKLITPTHEISKKSTESVNVDNSNQTEEFSILTDGNILGTELKDGFSLFAGDLSKSLMSQKADTVVTKSDTENKSLASSENTLKNQKSVEKGVKSGGVVAGGSSSSSDTIKSEKNKGAVKKELSPPPNPNRERRPSLKEELEETGVFLPIRQETTKAIKPERKSPTKSSIDQKLESHDQVEATDLNTLQQGNNVENPNLSGFKTSESIDSNELQLVVESVDIESNIINFNIGTSVRPQQTSLKLSSDTKELASIKYKIPSVKSVGSNFSTSYSFDDCTSLSPDSLSPTRSERARRRIAYIDQATFDEKEFYENGSREPCSSNLLSGLSGDFLTTATYDSSDISIDNSKAMPPIGALFIDCADVSAAMSTTSPEKREHLYKILVIGELGTGKTSYIKRYVHQFFSQSYRATIGVDFALKVLNWDQNTIIRLQLWDIAGQERFGNMTRVYYKEAVGAFIVFDVTRSATFDAAIKWKQDLDSKVQLPDGSSIPCILLANKCDQPKQGIVNTPAKMDEYVEENGFAGWFETSAKENINIEDAARALVNKILLNDKLLSSGDIIDAERFALDAKNDEATKKNCAC